MTVAEIVALGTMVTSSIGALAGAFATVMGVLNHWSIKAARASTDGMKDELVAEVRAGATAQGIQKGRDQVHNEIADTGEQH